jgi:hypothetical protein
MKSLFSREPHMYLDIPDESHDTGFPAARRPGIGLMPKLETDKFEGI